MNLPKTNPHDDPMDVVKCFEVEKILKEKAFEANPRRHWSEIQNGMIEELIGNMVRDGAIEMVTEKVQGLNEYRVHYKVHVMLPKKAEKE